MNFDLSRQASADFATFHASLVESGVVTAERTAVAQWMTADGSQLGGLLLANGEEVADGDTAFGGVTWDRLLEHVNAYDGNERYQIEFTRAGWRVHHFTAEENWRDFVAALPYPHSYFTAGVPAAPRTYRVAYFGQYPTRHALPATPDEDVHDVEPGLAADLLDLMWARAAEDDAAPRVIEIEVAADLAVDVRTSEPFGEHPVRVLPALAKLFRATVGQRDAFRAQFRAERAAAFAEIGEVDEYVFAPLLSGVFTGGPAWPGGREAFRVIRTPDDSTVVVSEGVSDLPETDGESIGVEVCCEIPGHLSLDEISRHLVYTATVQMATVALNHGGIHDLLRELDVLSIEFEAPAGTPPSLLDETGSFTVLLGLPSGSFEVEQTWGGIPVRLVSVVILSAADAAAAKQSGEERLRIADQFRRLPFPTLGELNTTVVG